MSAAAQERGGPSAYLVPGYKESYSIWLHPKGRLAQRLEKEIALLAEQHPGSPVFPPHVTLVPDIEQPGDKVIETAKQLASQLKKYDVSFLDVTRGSIYFQCVYLLCAKNNATMEAGALARQMFDKSPGPYMPHLSLLYADIPEAKRAEVVDACKRRFYGEGSGYDTLLTETSFPVDSISVWYTPTEDPTTQAWCLVADIPLS